MFFRFISGSSDECVVCLLHWKIAVIFRKILSFEKVMGPIDENMRLISEKILVFKKKHPDNFGKSSGQLKKSSGQFYQILRSVLSNDRTVVFPKKLENAAWKQYLLK